MSAKGRHWIVIVALHLTVTNGLSQVRFAIEDRQQSADVASTNSEESEGRRHPHQESSVGAPVLGYLLEASSRNLRPILGVVGSAKLGNEIEMPEGVSLAAVTSQRGIVLALAGSPLEGILIDLADSTQRKIPFSNSTVHANHLALSPSGTAAIFFSESAEVVRIVEDLADTPSVRSVALPLSGNLDAVAISDSSELLIAARDGDALSIFVVPRTETPRPILRTAGRVAMSFIEGVGDAVIGSAEDKRVYLVRRSASGEIIQLLANEKTGVSEPVAVAASRDGSRVFVANASGTILTIALDSLQITSTECDCKPDTLERLAGDEVFRLTGARGSIVLFSAGTPSPRVFVAQDNGPDRQSGGLQ